MYNEGYADGGGGSTSSCMKVVDFILHYTFSISDLKGVKVIE